ncbi:MAG: NAD(P)-dependent oxidoreductase [Planctomycetota bacterium]
MPQLPKVVITERLDEACAAWLEQHARVVWHRFDQPGLDAALADADGLVVRTYTQVDDDLLEQAPNVKVIGRAGVGLDNFDLPACERRGVRVVYTPDANTQAVVEYVMGLMLDHVRPRTPFPPPPEGTDARFHELRKTEVGRQLDEMTLGIVGFGRIGKRLGNAAHALGMNVWACDVLPEVELRKAVAFPFEFKTHAELYAGSHIVTVHADGRSPNRHLLDGEAFAAMRDDAVLINAARGMLVDHAALTAWLTDHPDAHAYLDVHDPEPPTHAEQASMRQLPNATLLPHLASRTHTALANMSWVVRDVLAVLQGEAPQYPAPVALGE